MKNLWISSEISMNKENLVFYEKDEWNTGGVQNEVLEWRITHLFWIWVVIYESLN